VQHDVHIVGRRQRRTNVWRKVTSPRTANATKKRRSPRNQRRSLCVACQMTPSRSPISMPARTTTCMATPIVCSIIRRAGTTPSRPTIPATTRTLTCTAMPIICRAAPRAGMTPSRPTIPATLRTLSSTAMPMICRTAPRPGMTPSRSLIPVTTRSLP
jgi:hypothetical protein